METVMSFDVVIAHQPGHMRITVSGRPSIGQLLSLIHLLGVESETWEQRAVLVDLRPVETPFTPEDQFRIGEEAAASLSHMDRIASVVPADRVTRISERAARRNGANVCVFDDVQAALAWLREE
jgi:hypothetical protein